MGAEDPEDPLVLLRARISHEARERFRRGEAVVGGKWWEIDPAQNYCDASSVLVRESEQRQTFGPLALPLTFLQRHAVELTLKSLARAAHDALDAMEQPLKRPDFDQNHSLTTWLERLKTALDAIGLPVPAAATTVVQALQEVGDRDGQNWRYGRDREKPRAPTRPAFQEERSLPVRQLQRQVEEFVTQSYGQESGGDGLFWDLGAIAQDPSVAQVLAPTHS